MGLHPFRQGIDDRQGECPHPRGFSVMDRIARHLRWPSRTRLIDCERFSMKTSNTLRTKDTGMKGTRETR